MMAAPAVPEPSEIEAPLRYLKLTELLKQEKAYISTVPFMSEGSRSSNVEEEEHTVPIHNVRGVENQFTLDKNGFQFAPCNFSNKPKGKIEGPDHPYLDEVAGFLKDLLGAQSVIVYDCNVRKIGDLNYFQPATSAHIDHSTRNCLYRFEETLKPYQDLTFQRWQAVTVWCPLSNAVTDWPLGVCDFQTVAEEDLQAVDIVLPHRVNEIYHLTFNERHRWYFLKDQRPDEALVMKTYDTDNSAARFCPHTSFDTRKFAKSATRGSTEVRAFVLY